ncbi:unnamed protein product [Prorocentrum cordatum]|uniref:Uncharacterized protein n=1 Tax=Prorocentrum cordatum TaxID=2364126 RepID=A0ABN9S3K3_9DINO|nr:unnamed protein product [Polarella glacialis]
MLQVPLPWWDAGGQGGPRPRSAHEGARTSPARAGRKERPRTAAAGSSSRNPRSTSGARHGGLRDPNPERDCRPAFERLHADHAERQQRRDGLQGAETRETRQQRIRRQLEAPLPEAGPDFERLHSEFYRREERLQRMREEADRQLAQQAVEVRGGGPADTDRMYARHAEHLERLEWKRQEAELARAAEERELLGVTVRGGFEEEVDVACSRLHNDAALRWERLELRRQAIEEAELMELSGGCSRLVYTSMPSSRSSLDSGGQPRWQQLYESARQRDERLAQEQMLAAVEEEQFLQNVSIHQTGSQEAQARACARLYQDGHAREQRQQLLRHRRAVDEAEDLADGWVHYRAEEAEAVAEVAANRLYQDWKTRAEKEQCRAQRALDSQPRPLATPSGDHGRRLQALYEDAGRREEQRQRRREQLEEEELEQLRLESVHAGAAARGADRRAWRREEAETVFERLSVFRGARAPPSARPSSQRAPSGRGARRAAGASPRTTPRSGASPRPTSQGGQARTPAATSGGPARRSWPPQAPGEEEGAAEPGGADAGKPVGTGAADDESQPAPPAEPLAHAQGTDSAPPRGAPPRARASTSAVRSYPASGAGAAPSREAARAARSATPPAARRRPTADELCDDGGLFERSVPLKARGAPSTLAHGQGLDPWLVCQLVEEGAGLACPERAVGGRARRR